MDKNGNFIQETLWNSPESNASYWNKGEGMGSFDPNKIKSAEVELFLFINILMVIIMPIDFLIDANYMYLKNPPAVDHPLVSGDWPYYLVNLEFVVLILVYFTYSLFKTPILRNKKSI